MWCSCFRGWKARARNASTAGSALSRSLVAMNFVCKVEFDFAKVAFTKEPENADEDEFTLAFSLWAEVNDFSDSVTFVGRLTVQQLTLPDRWVKRANWQTRRMKIGRQLVDDQLGRWLIHGTLHNEHFGSEPWEVNFVKRLLSLPVTRAIASVAKGIKVTWHLLIVNFSVNQLCLEWRVDDETQLKWTDEQFYVKFI